MEILIIAMCLIVLTPVYVGLFVVVFPKKKSPFGNLRPKNPPAPPRQNRPWRKTFFSVAQTGRDEQRRRGKLPQSRAVTSQSGWAC